MLNSIQRSDNIKPKVVPLAAGCFVCAILFVSCTNGQNSENSLSATIFAGKIKEIPAAQIVDVRTPEEFAKGHLVNARNIDWNGNDFDSKIAALDKSGPVFVYCLSGGRSAAAAKHMRAAGFISVYELSGGIMKWRSANLPETTEEKALHPGMSLAEFNKLLISDKMVLVDFYADWCEPCKKMKPFLKEISTDMADRVSVVRINVDNNQALCKALKIDELPVLHLYKSNLLVWVNTGYIDKAGITGQLK